MKFLNINQTFIDQVKAEMHMIKGSQIQKDGQTWKSRFAHLCNFNFLTARILVKNSYPSNLHIQFPIPIICIQN